MQHLITYSLIVALALGCAQPEPQSAPANVVARVGETDITLNRLERAVETLYSGAKAQIPNKERKDGAATGRRQHQRSNPEA